MPLNLRLALGSVRVRRAAWLGAPVVACLLALACPVPVHAARAPRLPVRGAALIDADTGRSLYLYNAFAQVPIASTTKLMTALVTLERAKLGTVFAAPNYYLPPADSQIGLRPGERMSVHDLLIALLLPSADDAAEDLAYNVGGHSISRFVAMMNVRARQLGLTHTHYSTPSGVDTPGNYSSATDLVALARYVMHQSAFFRRVVKLPSYTLHTGDQARRVVNRNDLVARFPWINGVKTGHTLQAGYVLVGSGARQDMNLVSVVLDTASESVRDEATLELLDYGFADFHRVTPVRRGQVIARPRVRYEQGVRAEVVAASTFSRIVPRDLRVGARVRVPAVLSGPRPRGARVGTLLVTAGGHVIARVALVLARALPPRPAPVSAQWLGVPITLLSALLLALGLALGAGFARKRVGGRAGGGRRRR